MYDLRPYLRRIDEVIAAGPYRGTWQSLCAYRTPAWYRDAKFGIFIHWGIYSVPAFSSEWYSRNMYIQGSPEYEHHRKTYGPQDRFGYKDFIPLFKGERFDAGAWATLFKESGARYVVPVAEHHDGFQMYKSEISHWNAFEMGPCRDVLGELKEACNARGLELGASSHRVEHWFFMGHGKDFASDVREPMQRGDFYWPAQPEGDHHDLFSTPTPTEEFMQDWLVRTCELIDRYRPRVLYFDWWIQHSAVRPWLRKLAAYYYDRAAQWGQEVVITYKHDAFLFGTAVPDVERGQFADTKPYYWQTDTAIGLNSWGYTRDNAFKKAADILQNLVDIVSKNGNLLLNVGPRPDGAITDEEQQVLRRIGAWLAVNGEAIYGARPFRTWGEGETQILEGQFSDGEPRNFTPGDIRFTVAGGSLYAIALKASADGRYTIRTLGRRDASRLANFAGIIRDVRVLGCDEAPAWTRDEEGLHITTSFRSEYPVTFGITLE